MTAKAPSRLKDYSYKREDNWQINWYWKQSLVAAIFVIDYKLIVAAIC